MQVKEIMAVPVVTSSTSAYLNDVAQIMWERDYGSLPVVDDDGRLVGIVTDRDVCMAAYTQGRALHEMSVSGAMASQVLACHIDDSVGVAGQLMREGQVRRLPVVDNDGRPVGIVTVTDLARAALQPKGVPAAQLVDTVVAVTEPRRSADRQTAAAR